MPCTVPTVLAREGLRFFFYSNESNEPMHIHVDKGSGVGKIWLEPTLEVAYMQGFSPAEARKIMHIVSHNIVSFKNEWREHIFLMCIIQ